MEFLRIGKLLQDYYAVPDYQREYEWTNTQNSTLLDDIIGLLYDQNTDNHFTGAIVSIPFEESNGVNTSIQFTEYEINTDNVKHIVDGQQRLTSLSVLMVALKRIIDQDQEIDAVQKQNYCDQLKRLLLGDESKSAGDTFVNAPRIVLSGNSGKCYNKAILGVSEDSYNGTYKGAKRLIAALKFFTKEIQTRRDELIEEGKFQNTGQFYKKLIEVIKNRIIFVEILCDGSSNAFQVFDSLNGKGLDLTAADRIKNILMSWSPSGKRVSKWDELVTKVGEDNLTNFFVALFFYNLGRRVSKNKLPDEFKTVYKDSAQTDFDYFFSELIRDGAYYGTLRRNNTGKKEIDELLKDLQQLNSEQVYVMLFAAMKHYDNVLSDDSFGLFLRAIIKLVVRMQVCEKSTNKLDSKFSEWIDLMKNHSASLQVITKKIDEFRKIFCDDNQFESAFEKFSPNDNSVSEYYLRCIENYKRKSKGDRIPLERGLTVEHIIPQGLDPEVWYEEEQVPEEIKEDYKNMVVERIGNKAILYGDDNSSANDNIYKDKRKVYEEGKRGQNQGTPKDTFQLISELLEDFPERFKYEEVEKRAEALSKVATTIW